MNKCILRSVGAGFLAAAAVTLGLAVPAQASPGDRSLSITIDNQSELRLRLTDSDVDQGQWTTRPTRLIRPDRSGALAAESTEEHGSTSGSVTYSTTEGDIEITWDNPWLEDSELECTAPGALTCDTNGLDVEAPNAQVEITIS